MNVKVQVGRPTEISSTAHTQGQLWSADANNWANFQEPMHRALWQEMFRLTHVKSGDRILDAGCGAGGLSVLAAKSGAIVCGIDASPALIAIARQSLPNAAFRVGSLEQLPYPDRSFDVVLAANSIQYTADATATLSELARVTVPNGRLAIGIWGKPDDCDLSVIFAAVRAALPAPQTKVALVGLSEAGALETALFEAGLELSTDCDIDCPFNYENVDVFWRAQRSAGIAQAVLQTVPELVFRKAILDAVVPYVSSNGSIRLRNKFRCVVARPK
jgi:SAM-dependent methyltransferase